MLEVIPGHTMFLKRRKKLLENCDWMFSPNSFNIINVDVEDDIIVKYDADIIELWKRYRQELRDVPQKNRDKPKAWKWLMPLNPDEWRELNARVTEEYIKKHNYSVDAPYLSVPQHFITYKQDIQFRYTIFTQKLGIYAKTKEEEIDNLLRNIIDNTQNY